MHIFQYESDLSCMSISAEELHEIYQAAIPLYQRLGMVDKVRDCKHVLCELEEIITEEVL